MNSRRSVCVCLSAVILAFGMTACVGPAEEETVLILGTWVGDRDLDKGRDLDKLLDPFRKRHPGINIEYEGTRDFDAILESRVQSGEEPDLAMLPNLGQFEQYAREGHLVAFDDVAEEVGLPRIEKEYSPAWLEFGKWGKSGKRYGIVFRGSRKNVIWYSPRSRTWPIPRSWQQLVDLVESVEMHPIKRVDASPWCVGLRSGSATGWPGTDWIEDILLRQSGADVYERWRRGELKWTDGRVRAAWEEWGGIVEAGLVNKDGSHRNRMLATDYRKAIERQFEEETGCYLHHVSRPQEGQHFLDFSTEEGKREVEVGGSILVMFNRTPTAEKLIDYLTGEEAQEELVSMDGVISPNVKVQERYPNEAMRDLAQTVDQADRIVFDASDYMPVAMRTVFHQAVLEFIAEPRRLLVDEENGILPGLEAVRCRLIQDGAYPDLRQCRL